MIYIGKALDFDKEKFMTDLKTLQEMSFTDEFETRRKVFEMIKVSVKEETGERFQGDE